MPQVVGFHSVCHFSTIAKVRILSNWVPWHNSAPSKYRMEMYEILKMDLLYHLHSFGIGIIPNIGLKDYRYQFHSLLGRLSPKGILFVYNTAASVVPS